MLGPTAVNVHALLETLRREGEILAIGAEVAALEARDQRKVQQAGGPAPGGAFRLPDPSAEVHMAVGSARLSNADGCKLYLHTGTATLTLRTETM